jgi:hypothetical protein
LLSLLKNNIIVKKLKKLKSSGIYLITIILAKINCLKNFGYQVISIVKIDFDRGLLSSHIFQIDTGAVVAVIVW